MMSREFFDYTLLAKKLYMSKYDIKNLSDKGNIIALHTHSHFTSITAITNLEQEEEYTKNKVILESITNKKVQVVAYPCGEFNDATTNIMNKLNVDIGFCSNMFETVESNLHIARMDHAEVLKLI